MKISALVGVATAAGILVGLAIIARAPSPATAPRDPAPPPSPPKQPSQPIPPAPEGRPNPIPGVSYSPHPNVQAVYLVQTTNAAPLPVAWSSWPSAGIDDPARQAFEVAMAAWLQQNYPGGVLTLVDLLSQNAFLVASW